jgi:hypothetical protein
MGRSALAGERLSTVVDEAKGRPTSQTWLWNGSQWITGP